MKKLMYTGAGMFLLGMCCGSLWWAAAMVVIGGSLAAIGGMYMEDADYDRF